MPPKIPSYPSLKTFIQRFSDARPLALARSALHLQLAPRSWEGDQAPPPPWALSAEMLEREMVGDGAKDPLPPPPPSPAMDTLMEQAVIALGNWVQATLLNRARQRRRLRRGCEDMSNLLQHALIAEACPLVGARLASAGWRLPQEAAGHEEEGPLANFVEAETCAQMLGHLSLSFELHLIETATDLAMTTWYIDYLAGTRLEALRRLGGRQKPIELLTLDVTRALSQGMFRLALALKVSGAVNEPASSCGGGLDEIFELRFGWAGALERPSPLSAAAFARASDVSAVPLPRLLGLARDSFLRAKQLCDLAGASSADLDEHDRLQLADLSRTAAANAIAASMLLGGCFQASFKVGRGGWPVVTLRRKP
jgi:hypothetical protein